MLLCESAPCQLVSASTLEVGRAPDAPSLDSVVVGPMNGVDALDRGRKSFQRKEWGAAFARLSAADAEVPLGPADLERLAEAAYLAGRDPDSEEAWSRAHHQSLTDSDWGRAARCAFWLGITLINRNEKSKGGGWLARAQRVLDDAEHDCVERGWLLVPLALKQYQGRDLAASRACWERAGRIGASYGDVDLVTIARQGEGRTLIRMGEIERGVTMLDEAMVAVAAEEVSPIPAGIVYCSVIEICQEIHDIRRAQEWTSALSAWCDSQPDLVPYRGRCLVHRSEIMLLHGEWPDALAEALRACEQLSMPPQPQLGAAFYQRGELHRLRGEFVEAEEAYGEAAERGRRPQPGLALLRLAQGKADAAAAAIRRSFDATTSDVTRSRVLPAFVDIMLAIGDVGAARGGTDEFALIATRMDSPLMRGVAARVEGTVLLAESQPSAALRALDKARMFWEDLDVPYEVARLRVVAGLAYRELGDEEDSHMELDAARRVFEQLGAAPEIKRLDALMERQITHTVGGLTDREIQVLRLVAAGKTNRAIAAELVVSQRTVDRHVSNIFTKLGVSSRAAATAQAYEHQLV
ncbi:MAG: helix-turn-helix transcriptional regulator [Actinomycetota bacterium]